MTVLDTQIYKPLAIFSLEKNNRQGLIVLGTYNSDLYQRAKGKLNFNNMLSVPFDSFEFYGESKVDKSKLGKLPTDYYEKMNLKKKTLRTWDSFESKVRLLLPTGNMKGISLCNNSLTYVEPLFIDKSERIICAWKSALKKDLDANDFKFIDGCLVFEYVIPIFILTDDSRRHLAVDLKERFIINTVTGRITCEYKNIINNTYIQCNLIWKNGQWVYVSRESQRILGFKQR